MKPQSLRARTKITLSLSKLKMNKSSESKPKKKKCLNHPAMECPTPNEQCIFTQKTSEKAKTPKPS
jgi:hypothetical protein